MDVTSPTATVQRRADEQQLRAMIDEFAPSIYRTALAIVRDSSLAEDVTQETIIRAWEAYGSFRGDGSMRGWVLRIAHNQAVSALRRVRDEAWDPTQMPEAESNDRTADPEHLAQLIGDCAEIREVLDRLDPLTRSILVLREMEGLSYEQIAEAVGQPVPTIRARLFRLRQGFEKSRLNGQTSDSSGEGR
jgi:RNA polymerase sigma-70 factor (ECF subfamily)